MAVSKEAREARTSWMHEMRQFYRTVDANVGVSGNHPAGVIVKAMATKGFQTTFERVAIALGFGSGHSWEERLKTLRELQQEFDTSQKPA